MDPGTQGRVMGPSVKWPRDLDSSLLLQCSLGDVGTPLPPVVPMGASPLLVLTSCQCGHVRVSVEAGRGVLFMDCHGALMLVHVVPGPRYE